MSDTKDIDDLLEVIASPIPNRQLDVTSKRRLLIAQGLELLRDSRITVGPGPVSRVEGVTISAEAINVPCLAVQRLSPNPEVQASILAHALVTCCKATGISCESMLDVLEDVYEESHEIVVPSAGGRAN